MYRFRNWTSQNCEKSEQHALKTILGKGTWDLVCPYMGIHVQSPLPPSSLGILWMPWPIYLSVSMVIPEKTMFHIGVIWSSLGPIVTWSRIIPDPVKIHDLLRKSGSHLVESWTNRDLVMDQSWFGLGTFPTFGPIVIPVLCKPEVQLEDSSSRHFLVSGTLSTKPRKTFFTTSCLSVQSLHSYMQSLHKCPWFHSYPCSHCTYVSGHRSYLCSHCTDVSGHRLFRPKK